MTEFAIRWGHVTPWLRPVWMSGWDFALAIAAVLLALSWTGVELVARRRRILAGARRLLGR